MKNRRTSASRPGLPRRETALYAPIRDYLVGNGYDVRAEVTHCDIVARKGDDLIIVELKRQFGVDLLVQATARQRISDSVYVAIPAPEYFGRGSRWTGLKRLLRHLELGLIVVFLDSSIPRVEVVFHPLPYQRRKRKAARRAALEEAASRSGDYNLGGSTQTKLVTAYRENAIHIACCLERFGPMAPCQLRALGTGPKTTAILGANFYGWFRRVHRAVYALTAEGKADLAAYPDLARQYREKLGRDLASDNT